MHTTDLIELVTDLLPGPVRRFLALAVCVALMTGVGTPLVTWFVETKAHEMQSDLQPILDRMLSATTSIPTR